MHEPLNEFLSVQLSRAVWNKNTIVRLTNCTSHWTRFVGATESRGLKKKNGRTSDWMHEPLNKFCQCVLTCVTSSFRKNYIFYPPHYLFYCSISASLYLDRSEWHRSYVVSRKTTMIGPQMFVLEKKWNGSLNTLIPSRSTCSGRRVSVTESSRSSSWPGTPSPRRSTRSSAVHCWP